MLFTPKMSAIASYDNYSRSPTFIAGSDLAVGGGSACATETDANTTMI